jgi:hypothetical protein
VNDAARRSVRVSDMPGVVKVTGARGHDLAIS